MHWDNTAWLTGRDAKIVLDFDAPVTSPAILRVTALLSQDTRGTLGAYLAALVSEVLGVEGPFAACYWYRCQEPAA